MAKRSKLGTRLEDSLKEALAWRRGEVALEAIHIDPMPATRIQAIRKAVAPSAKKFAETFGLPPATVNNWEQGRRKPDPAARLLLQVIEANPGLVARVANENQSKQVASKAG
jgi:putative transcriptional regulator